MSPQDQVERVLKEIHVFFSKCERCTDDPAKLKVDQQQFVDLLERLNYGIYDLMDRYEQTQISAGETERAARKQGEQIIEQAQKKADDVYAASLLFTADAIGGIREVMERMQDSMNDMMRQVKKDLFFQREELQKNESEIRSQLTDLADTQTYLMLLDEISHERAMGKRDLLREREIGRTFARNLAGSRSPQAEQYYRRRAAGPGEEDILDLDAETEASAGQAEMVQEKPAAGNAAGEGAAGKEEPEIIINRDAAYFKWKEAQQEQPEQKLQQTKDMQKDAVRQTAGKDSREDTVIREIRSETAGEAAGRSRDAVILSELDGSSGGAAPAGDIELPNEEDLLKAVMMDEMSLYGEKGGRSGGQRMENEVVREPESFDSAETPHRHGGVGGRLKDFLLGRDLVDED